MRFRFIFSFLLAAIAVQTSAAAPPSATIYYSIAAEGGVRLGYASQQAEDHADGRDVVHYSVMRLQEMDSPAVAVAESTVSHYDKAGRLVSISQNVRTGRSWSRVDAQIGDSGARISRQTSSGRATMTVPFQGPVRFDDGQGLLAGWDPAATPRLEFDNFSLGAMAVERVVIEPAAGVGRDPDGRFTALRKRYDGAELRSIAKLLLDRRNRILAVTQPMFGTSITTQVVDRESALAPHPAFHVLRAAMVKSPFRIPASAMAGQIRYRFAYRDGLAFPLPQTGEQRAAQSSDGVTVDICGQCGPGLAHDEAYLADARKPTLWMQSDDPRLRAIAAPVARSRLSDTRKMELLLERARPFLKKVDFVGHYSALETIERRAGDCTEAAVLLAALGRAAGIPTRVVNGLAYSRQTYHGLSNTFMPHSWTLAWTDGAWRSFDLALDTFDSSHIALTVGDGDSRSVMAASQLASLLQWEAMTEVRAAPAG